MWLRAATSDTRTVSKYTEVMKQLHNYLLMCDGSSSSFTQHITSEAHTAP